MSFVMRLLYIFAIGLQLWTRAVVGDDPLTIQELFNVDLTSNDNGGCRGHEARLDSFLFEAVALADAGVNLLQDAVTPADNPQAAPASRLLESYFRGSMRGDQAGRRLRRLIRNNYVAVALFLTENLYNGPGGKPNLFCSDEWSYYVTWDEPARDNRGQIYTNENKELVRNKNAPGLNLAWNSPTAIDLLWSTVHNAYIVQRNENGEDERRICSVSGGTMGNVQFWGIQPSLELPRVLTLCSRLWGKPDARLGSVAPVVATQDEIVRRKAYADATGDYVDLDRLQAIHNIMPPSATFFHELMHLVLGKEPSYPENGEVYLVDDIMEMVGTESARNPESYSKAAVAYWYTTNKEGAPEYWGGYATQG
ncbi:hypothetical protein F5X68DRAFT_247990 [Plectosphaerella plurivora]|uniref:Uncharacterized protein n=1 Tax=Plectosphaerella plurivora TaxID=936078 RepID=A0A9P8VHL1_9PEZI|nr:hypothetical protein F5X68DRAFT_247990 [Plectosphaerella plurivora]